MSKFEIFIDQKDEYRFRLKTANGEVILASEGYTTKANCKNGIESVKSNATNEDLYEIKNVYDDKFHFVLKATNGQIIGSGETYNSKSAVRTGINSIKMNAPLANVIELESA